MVHVGISFDIVYYTDVQTPYQMYPCENNERGSVYQVRFKYAVAEDGAEKDADGCSTQDWPVPTSRDTPAFAATHSCNLLCGPGLPPSNKKFCTVLSVCSRFLVACDFQCHEAVLEFTRQDGQLECDRPLMLSI
jgi:hypothetical protein